MSDRLLVLGRQVLCWLRPGLSNPDDSWLALVNGKQEQEREVKKAISQLELRHLFVTVVIYGPLQKDRKANKFY